MDAENVLNLVDNCVSNICDSIFSCFNHIVHAINKALNQVLANIKKAKIVKCALDCRKNFLRSFSYARDSISNTFLQSGDNVSALFGHYGGWGIDSKGRLKTIDKWIEHIFNNPRSNIRDCVLNAMINTVDDI